jgi:hypothetical protein
MTSVTEAWNEAAAWRRRGWRRAGIRVYQDACVYNR